ncbi:Gfo/Idh/MocA family protein [Lentzea sp. NPDC055074]
MSKVRWGLLVTGGYADVAVKAGKTAAAGEFTAVACDDSTSAQEYAGRHGIARSHGSYAELLADPDVDAVFVAVHPADHAHRAIQALTAGKHVLVEKPLALDVVDAERVFAAAEAAGRICAEGMMYRHHPQFELARRMVDDGEIGDLRYVYAACTASLPPDYFRRSRELGGGGMLDLGVFALAAIRYFAGEPRRVYAEEVRHGAAADHNFCATLRMPGDVLAQFEVGQEVCRGDALEVVGTTGRLVLRDPWFCRDVSTVELQRQGPPPHLDPVSEHLPVDPEGLARCAEPYAGSRLQFDAVSEAIMEGARPPFGRADAVAQARAVAALFESSAKHVPVELA